MSTRHQHTTSRDTSVDGPHGRLFVRTWSPETPSNLAPIVLLHDSLGSVELWRYRREALPKLDAQIDRLAALASQGGEAIRRMDEGNRAEPVP